MDANDYEAIRQIYRIVRRKIKNSTEAKKLAVEIFEADQLIYPWIVCPHCGKELATKD